MITGTLSRTICLEEHLSTMVTTPTHMVTTPMLVRPPNESQQRRRAKKSCRIRVGFQPEWIECGCGCGRTGADFSGNQRDSPGCQISADSRQHFVNRTCRQGVGDNIHLTISGVEPLDGQSVYEARNRAATSYTKVFIPCIPANSNARSVQLLLFSTDAADDNAVGRLMNSGTHTGMIFNDIRGLGSDEKKLFQGSLGGRNANDVMIFEVGRTPSAAGTRVMFFVGGAALSLGGLA